MKVGLLIVTHNLIGAELLRTATDMLGGCPMRTAVIEVTTACDPEKVLEAARCKVELLDEGRGVIVLTDMYGSTPANITQLLQQGSTRIDVITGVNLPMVVRLLNYASLDRAQMVEKALSGGGEGIFSCKMVDEDNK